MITRYFLCIQWTFADAIVLRGFGMLFAVLMNKKLHLTSKSSISRCGNVAAILELDENLNKQFRVFEAAPHVRSYNLFFSKSSSLSHTVNSLSDDLICCRNLEEFLQRNQPLIIFSEPQRRRGVILFRKFLRFSRKSWCRAYPTMLQWME